MTIVAISVLSTATTTLQDETFVHWTQPELLGYLNDGARALVTLRPDVNTVMAPVVPVAGPRQQLPNEAVTFVDIIGNTSGKQRQITRVDFATLSATMRDWQSEPQSATALHFMYDQRDPRTYYLYPPSNGLGSIDMLYSAFPAVVTGIGDVLSIDLQWKNALTHYVVARAYSKDAEYGGNAALAAQHMGLFDAAAVAQLQSATAVSPKS